MVKNWTGHPQPNCDFCGNAIPLEGEFIDGRISGRTTWAIMCVSCHSKYGVGIGVGKGQRYVFNPKGYTWEKVEG